MAMNQMKTYGEGTLIPTLKGHFYTDPTIFESEMKNIFMKSWFCVGFANEAAQPGQYFTAKIGNENVIIIRGKDNVLRAFINACKHRGSLLCTQEKGKVGKVMQCPYHAWNYSLDGKLASVPHTTGCSQDMVHDEAFHLTPVHLTEWHGMVWISLADDPLPVEKQLDEQIMNRFGNLTTFSRYGIQDLKVARRIEYDVKANWKLIIENFMECYHCTLIHPELTATLPGFRGGKGTQNAIGSGAKFGDNIEAFSLTGKGGRSMLKGLQPEDDRTYFGITVLPQVFINLVPDHVIIHRMIPIAEDRTMLVCDWLFDPEEMEKPDFDPSDAVELFHRVNTQDFDAAEWCQTNMGSRAYQNGGVFVPIEHHIANFHTYICNELGMKHE
ncbi:aromatic ring-hydroxylating oxygenase subunit alpha [Paenibacillus beijingensis]|uniref:2Fe-2S ferredoxin n=1 Tax=Paenibacillus beijingensis TaxID=1126833 RepID=A0A0D5NHI4_9BACL|nr:aromatic ring-hydroxylating dioxygenase subunit alpha [Paenibacillus beijingensis]AJY74432.1 2Fe-2S ferredoxin [Paenibacillus beijingensis]